MRLGPSSASTWLKCTAMPGFVARHSSLLPPNDSKYSREGTDAHERAKSCLLLGICEPSMYRHIKDYFDIVQAWASLPNTVMYVEQKVELFYDSTNEGTMDAGVVKRDGSRVWIGDLKYGAGKSVQALNNPQIAIYALSFIAKMEALGVPFTDNTFVSLMIYQPRVIGEKSIRVWSLTLGELKVFGEQIGGIAAEIIFDPDGGVFSPDDDTCQFCHAVSFCTARTGQLLGVTPKQAQRELLGPPVQSGFPEVETLSVEQLARIVRVAPSMREWLTKCETFGAGRLHNGKQFPGFKLVEGRSNRKWTDKAKAIQMLEFIGMTEDDFLTEVELKSPSQVMEILKSMGELDAETKEELSALIDKPPGKAVLVPDDDPRAPYDQNPLADFESVSEGSDLLG